PDHHVPSADHLDLRRVRLVRPADLEGDRLARLEDARAVECDSHVTIRSLGRIAVMAQGAAVDFYALLTCPAWSFGATSRANRSAPSIRGKSAKRRMKSRTPTSTMPWSLSS